MIRAVAVVALLAGASGAVASAPAARRTAERGLPRGGSYRVFLPPDYPRGAPYPVVYFLHDILGDSRVLWRHGVTTALAAAMGAGALPAVVVVAPDGGKGYWSDFHARPRPYETWLTGNLRRAVERDFAVRSDRGGRAIAGVSMGGFGAVKAALRRPDLYCRAASISGVLFPNDWQLLEDTFWLNRLALKRVFGWTREDNSFGHNDIYRLAAVADPAAVPPLDLRCGRSDKYGLAEVAARFQLAAESRGLRSTLLLEPGGHDWSYWRKSVLAALSVHAAGFAEARP